ncbi:MAG: sigma-70 family RNA polymerase sigma factor [Calditrichales bacterium]|nr:MAG: sigma-70 family RNA polymerase sigma factor [Calditrichales bacterium]
MRVNEVDTDASLMQRFQAGDKEAFHALYERYAQSVLRYLFRMLGGDDSRAQDILQDVFLRVAGKPHYFNPEFRFSTWLFSIASNLCKNEYRYQAIRRNYDPSVDLDIYGQKNADVDKKLDMKTFENALQAELMQLETEQRSIFLLRHQENYSIKEIARILDCPEGTVKSRLFNVSKKLASQLMDYHPEA